LHRVGCDEREANNVAIERYRAVDILDTEHGEADASFHFQSPGLTD
jgi:hypothetical protein